MRARFNPSFQPGAPEIKGYDGIGRELPHLLAHQEIPIRRDWPHLLELLWSRFCKGERDFYCWDEMTKASEMKFLLESNLQPGPVLELCCGFSYWVREVMGTVDIGVDLFPDEGSYSRSIDALADDFNFAGNTYKVLIRADVTQPLPVPEASISNIISFCAFEHIPSALYPRLFRGIRRMLRPGGRLVFSVQTRLCYQTLYQYLNPDLVTRIRAEAAVAELFDACWWDKMLTESGFQILKRKGAIDRERSLMYALSFAPGGFGSNPLSAQYSRWLRRIGTDHRPWFDEAMEWLCHNVDPNDADLLFYEVGH